MPNDQTTYAQTRHVPLFDWNDFLQRANTNQITQKESENAEEEAASWVTCACGNQCAIIPRFSDGEPKDKPLRQLGYQFFYAIEEEKWGAARETLREIEIRAAELIREIKE